jgi:hypothetical protein
MKKTILSFICIVGIASSLMAQSAIVGTFNGSSSGTTSCTAFVDQTADGFAQITDLNWKIDAGCTTGFIAFRSADTRYSSTSATSASGSVAWFDNAGGDIAAQDYIIIYDSSARAHYLRKVTVAATTSVTVSEAITPALTTGDYIYSVNTAVERPIQVQSTTAAACSIWLPRGKPVAITLDGNTTACRLSFSGVKSPSK